MTPSLICQQCGTETALGGETTTCRGCGREYPTAGLSGAGAKRPKATEADVQRRIVEALEAMGFHVSKLDQGYRADGSTRQTSGLPDLWAMHPKLEVALWIEVKGPDTPLRQSQRTWHTIARTSGVHVTVARSVEDVVAYLEEVGAEIEVGA